MTSPQAGNPIEVQIEKVRNIQPGDSVIAKAVAEAVGQELEALFRASRYRRIFRVVRGNVGRGGLVVSAATHELGIVEHGANPAMLHVKLVLQASSTRTRRTPSGLIDWDEVPFDPSDRVVPQAVRIFRTAVQREGGAFVERCEELVTRG